jgi:hypothetical protein
MIKTTQTFIRPNRTIDWFETPAAVEAHVQAAYVNTGKLVSQSVKSSRLRNLVRTYTMTWSSLAAYQEFTADSVVAEHENDQVAYYATNFVAMNPRYIEDI